MHELAKHYVTSDQAEKAIDVYNAITAINPADGEATKGGKGRRCEGFHAFGRLGTAWQEGSSYRDVLKNKEEAKALEQENRLVKSEGDIDALLEEQFALYNENPNNLAVVLKIAKLHSAKGRHGRGDPILLLGQRTDEGGDPGVVRSSAS